jgi:hypothetical protein
MTSTTPKQNKALVLEAFDTLFNKRDYAAASRFWSDEYIQHSAHIEPGREGLFELIRSLPDSLRYEHSLILAEGDYVIVHGRFSGTGRPGRVGGHRRGADRERRPGRALGRAPGRGDPSRIEERIAHARLPRVRQTNAQEQRRREGPDEHQRNRIFVVSRRSAVVQRHDGRRRGRGDDLLGKRRRAQGQRQIIFT